MAEDPADGLADRQRAPDQELVSLAIEAWRFARVYARAVSRLDATEQPRYASQLRYFLKQVEDALAAYDLSLVNLEGNGFDGGLPITVVNLEEFTPLDQLVVAQMLEPVVMGPAGVVRMGSAVLKRVDA